MNIDNIKCPVCGCGVNLHTNSLSINRDESKMSKDFYLECENCYLKSRDVRVYAHIQDDGFVFANDLELKELINEWRKKNG